MNRIDRLFGILLRLQNRATVRAEELAKTFEVSRRTIYRDMAALSEMGVPIVSLPGEGYQIMEGFYLPPLVFTPAEATALILGARMLALQAAGKTAQHAESAVEKIVSILPTATREQAERLSEIVHFYVPPERFDLDDPRLLVLQRAILERRPIFIRYHSYSGDELTSREVEPDRLSYSAGSWYVSGYCRLRQDRRAFRLDRIEALDILPGRFEDRATPNIETERREVRVRFAAAVVRWVRERQHYAFQSEGMITAEGDVEMVYQVKRLDEIRSWLFGWGTAAEVLSPDDLRQAIRQEAVKLADMLT